MAPIVAARPAPPENHITSWAFLNDRGSWIMNQLTNREMIEKAKTVLRPRKLSDENTAGGVACVLLSSIGNLYLGVCIDVGSGMGFCAEHSAIAAMITAGESSIAKIVAVCGDDTVLSPCGRCREFVYQIDKTNVRPCRPWQGRRLEWGPRVKS